MPFTNGYPASTPPLEASDLDGRTSPDMLNAEDRTTTTADYLHDAANDLTNLTWGLWPDPLFQQGPPTMSRPPKSQGGYNWYCCHCRSGPMSVEINVHCANCQRQRCAGCTLEKRK